MANKYVIQLEVDQSGVINNVDTVEKKFEAIADSTNSVKKELRDLQKQLAGLDQGSAEFQKLAKRAGELKDRLNDAAEAARNNAGNAFEVLGNNTRNLKDAVLNLDFEGVASSLRGVAGAAGSLKVSDITNGFKALGSSFATLGKALLTNPLFLIITGVGLLIANFDKLTSALDGVTDAQVASAEAAQKAADASKAQYDWVSANENTLKLQGKSEKEITEMKKQQLDLAIAQQAAAIEQQKVILETQIQAAERNKTILKGILDFLSAPLQVVARTIDYVGKAVGQDFGLAAKLDALNTSVAELVFDPAEMRAQGEATIAEAQKNLDALKNTQAGIILSERKAAADRAAERKKEADARLEAERKAAEEVSALVAELEAQTLKEMQDAENAKRAIEYKANQDRIAALDAQFALEQELTQSATEKEIAALVAKYDEQTLIAGDNAELQKQLAQKLQDDLATIEKQAADKKAADEKKVRDAKIQVASDTLSAIADLNNSFVAKSKEAAKRQFNINKGIAIAQALIQTYQSAVAAYNSQAGIPVVGPALGGIAAGAAVVAGIAQVNKIRQTQFDGGGAYAGGSPSVGGGGGAPQAQGAPQFNPVNTDFVNNRPDQQAARSYVLAVDVANGVEARRKIDQQARLG